MNTTNKVHAALLALIAITTLLIAACGLEGDLYIPEEEAKTAPAEAQTAEEQNTDDPDTDDSSSAPTP